MAAISLTANNPYTQNFDTLAITGTTNTLLPEGWEFLETESNANLTYAAGTGSSNAGNTYSFGSDGSTERALGGLQSGSLIPIIGASFTNSTGSTITSLAITYRGEQWRLGSAGRVDRLDFQYSLDAMSLITGTWTDVDVLDFSTPNTATTGAKDGNGDENSTDISHTITGLNIPAGATFYIRWTDFNATGSDDGLAIDDFSITANPSIVLPPTNDYTIGGFSFDAQNIVTIAEIITPIDGSFNSGLLQSSGAPLASQTVGALLNQINLNHYVVLGEDPNVNEPLVNPRSEIELTWGGLRLVNDSGDDFVVYENGSRDAPEAYAVAVRRTSTGQFTDFLYQFYDTFDDPAVNGPADNQGVSSTAFDLSDFGLESGESIDAIHIINLISTDTVSSSTGDGFVNLPNVEGVAPKTTLNGDPFAESRFDPDITLVAALRDLEPAPIITKIHEIQGTGATANFLGAIKTIEAIVVGDFQNGDTDTGRNLSGFYLQEEDGDADNNPLTSEGIFVFDNNFGVDVNVGDKVLVTGVVAEFTSGTSSLTQLRNITTISIQVNNQSLPTAATVSFPVNSTTDLEAYEGMLVDISSNLTVTEHFQLGRFGQVVLSADGPSNQLGTDGRLDQFTQFNDPNAANYSAYLAEIAKRRIVLDDGLTIQNPDPIIHARDGQPLSASNTLRGGDTVTGLTGILDDRFGAANIGNYRLQPIAPVDFQGTNPRPSSTPDVGGNLKIASFNVLNYFNGDGTGNDASFNTPEQRGADSLAEFNRQRDKTIAAILGMDAAVVGLIEIENDGYDSLSAIQDLVNGLNAIAGSGAYAFIDPELARLGTDDIAVGFIYQPGLVTPVGNAATIPDGFGQGAFDDDNRKPLAQTFEEIATHGQFTAVINHLKSKGSSAGKDGDADAGDGQGLSNGTRTRAAQDLASWLATNPTGTRDTDYLVLGDLNAYAQEDPIVALKDAGYTNLLPDSTYSFVFDGQWGSLDYALATGTLEGQVTGAEKWHINADEPNVLDYNTEFKSADQLTSLYAADAFRSSDHDPVIVGLDLTPSSINGDDKDNFLYGTPDDDKIKGFGGNDYLFGEGGNDKLYGGEGYDYLYGGPGNDTLYGEEKNDSLYGEDGDDILIGGPGADNMRGGRGNDKFVYNALNEAGDRIFDFNPSQDQLVLTELFTSLGYGGTNPIADGYLRFSSFGLSTRVQIDADGSLNGSSYTTLTTLSGVFPSSLSVGTNVVVI